MLSLNRFFTVLVLTSLVASSSFAQQKPKAQLEKRVKRMSKQIEQAAQNRADMLSRRELKEIIANLKNVKQIFGIGGGGSRPGPGPRPQPTGSICDISYEKSGYYMLYFVNKNGKKFSSGFSQFDAAVKKKNVFISNGECEDDRYSALAQCSIKYEKVGYYNLYRVYVGRQAYSAGSSRVQDAAKFMKKLANASQCEMPSNRDIGYCDIELEKSGYYNLYFVKQDGQRLSAGFSQYEAAASAKQVLEDSYMCQ